MRGYEFLPPGAGFGFSFFGFLVSLRWLLLPLAINLCVVCDLGLSAGMFLRYPRASGSTLSGGLHAAGQGQKQESARGAASRYPLRSSSQCHFTFGGTCTQLERAAGPPSKVAIQDLLCFFSSRTGGSRLRQRTRGSGKRGEQLLVIRHKGHSEGAGEGHKFALISRTLAAFDQLQHKCGIHADFV